MRKTEAEELSAKLHHEAIDHELRINHYSPAACSVRAFLTPLDGSMWGAEDGRDYARKVFDAMTGEGDWEISGEAGRAHITQY